MNEKMTKAIVEGKFKLIIDTSNKEVNVEYLIETDAENIEMKDRYDVVYPKVDNVLEAIKYAVDYCTRDGKVNLYLKDIGVVKGILKYYTNMPDDYFTDEDIDTIINNNLMSYVSDIALRRYYEAVEEEVDNIMGKFYHTTDFQRFLDSIVGGFTVENKETNELFSGLIGTIVDRYGELFDDKLK